MSYDSPTYCYDSRVSLAGCDESLISANSLVAKVSFLFWCASFGGTMGWCVKRWTAKGLSFRTLPDVLSLSLLFLTLLEISSRMAYFFRTSPSVDGAHFYFLFVYRLVPAVLSGFYFFLAHMLLKLTSGGPTTGPQTLLSSLLPCIGLTAPIVTVIVMETIAAASIYGESNSIADYPYEMHIASSVCLAIYLLISAWYVSRAYNRMRDYVEGRKKTLGIKASGNASHNALALFLGRLIKVRFYLCFAPVMAGLLIARDCIHRDESSLTRSGWIVSHVIFSISENVLPCLLVNSFCSFFESSVFTDKGFQIFKPTHKVKLNMNDLTSGDKPSPRLHLMSPKDSASVAPISPRQAPSKAVPSSLTVATAASVNSGHQSDSEQSMSEEERNRLIKAEAAQQEEVQVQIRLSRQIARFWSDPVLRELPLMKDKLAYLFSFPTPINSPESQLVGVLAFLVITLGLILDAWSDSPAGLFFISFACWGFFNRTLCGPRFDLLSHIVLSVLRPLLIDRWGVMDNNFVAGPPRRFAQAIGLMMSFGCLMLRIFLPEHLRYIFYWTYGAFLVILSVLAFDNLCMGCFTFALLFKIGLIPKDWCSDCMIEWQIELQEFNGALPSNKEKVKADIEMQKHKDAAAADAEPSPRPNTNKVGSQEEV